MFLIICLMSLIILSMTLTILSVKNRPNHVFPYFFLMILIFVRMLLTIAGTLRIVKIMLDK